MKLGLIACIALTVLGAGVARAETPPLGVADIEVDPTAYPPPLLYPSEAAKRGLSGRALVRCTGEKTGDVMACHAASEAPVGLGFAPVAIAMVESMKFKPVSKRGEPLAGRIVEIPMAFYWEKGVGGVDVPSAPADAPQLAYDLPSMVAASAFHWRRVDPIALARHFPLRAQQNTKGGTAVLLCGIGPNGRLQACTVMAESPSHYDFGEAALEIAPLMQVADKTKSGEPAAGKLVVVTVPFRYP